MDLGKWCLTPQKPPRTPQTSAPHCAGATRCRPRVTPLVISCPCQLRAVALSLDKQPRPVVRAVRLWSPEAQESVSLKKFSLIFATAASNTMQYVLGCFRELCERSRELMVWGVAGAWGRDCVFSPFPALLSSPKPPGACDPPSPGPRPRAGEQRGDPQAPPHPAGGAFGGKNKQTNPS